LDALQFILAGASAVSVGTEVFHDPTAPIRVLAELEEALAARGFSSLSDAVGLAHGEHRPSDELPIDALHHHGNPGVPPR
ncbi:MAG: dihydroorotate dehydrogenase catalytic subunit, partial [Actinomycetota bacterium]|nr:dihydroorotate dehydrogenase catalytic subunit [Actinomycetota bacterium]